MKRWLAVLLLMFGGLGAEAFRPGPCELISNTRTERDGPGRRRPERTRRDGAF